MLQSQFNLDHRLAELRQLGIELNLERAARASSGRAQSIGAQIRALLGGTPPSTQPAGFATAR
jgi:hypothetical protein